MEFRVLGELEVRRDGAVVDVGAYRQRALLALLLANAGSVLSTDAIIDRLWGEEVGGDRQSSVWVYVSGLRTALEPGREKRTDGTILLTRAPGYVLDVDPDSVDSIRFERMVAEGRLLAASDPSAASMVLGEALMLWRGRAYEEFTYEPFAQDEIARLEELRLAAVEARIDADLARGLAGELVSELETLVREHPLREGLTGQLMIALHRSGRRAEALRAYQHLSHRLGEELGLEPTAAIRTLEHQIVTGELAEPHAPPGPPIVEPGLAVRGYELRDRIATGAVGEAFRAYQPSVGREVVVTVVKPEIANDPDYIRRFESEAQIVASLDSPHIVPLYDYWREPDAAYLVTKLLAGGTLAALLERRALDRAEVHRLVGQLGDALAAAHRAGVAHRHIAPETVLVDDEGNAYLYDVGYVTRSSHDGDGVAIDVANLATIVADALVGPPDRIEALEGSLPADVHAVVERARSGGYGDVLAFVRAAQAALAAPGQEAPTTPIDVDNPYKGLRAFSGSDAERFHGRERLVERLVNRLAHPASHGRFVALVGPSGSGKSSVARAGLLPALRRGAAPMSEAWFTTEMTPAPHPFEALEDAILAIAADRPPSLLELLASEHGLHRVLGEVLPPDGSQVVLLVDQFEELFTQVDDDVADHFLDVLVHAVTEPHSRLRLVVTLRADFYDRPLRHRGVGELLRNGTEVITPMSPGELERAIVGPLEGTGISFDPALVATLVHDVSDATGALPLLQYALTELFDARTGSHITLDAYRELGGVSGSLVTRADGLLAQLGPDAVETTRQVFLRLVTLGEGASDTRRRVLRTELEQLPRSRRELEAVLDMFGRHRLLSFDRDPVSRGPTVEIAHESLLSAWAQLRTWIDGARNDVRTHRRLVDAMNEWTAAGRSDDYLLRGGRLEQIHGWIEFSSFAVSADEREYLDASIAERDRAITDEREREQRALDAEAAAQHRVRQLRLAAVAGLVVAALAVFGIWQWRSADDARANAVEERAAADVARIAAENERRAADDARAAAERARAESDRLVEAATLVTAAEGQLTRDRELSLLYAVEAIHSTAPLGYATEEAVDAVHWALQDLGFQFDVDRSTPVAVRSGPRGLTGVYALAPSELVAFAEQAVSRTLTEGECVAATGAPCPVRTALDPDLPLRFGSDAYGLDARVGGFYRLGGAAGPLAGTRLSLSAAPLASDSGFLASLARFTEVTGIEVDVVNASSQDLREIASGELDMPDLVAGLTAVPGWARARALDLETVLDADSVRDDFSPGLLARASFPRGDGSPDDDAVLRAVPVKGELKGLVFYPKAAFDQAGYAVPRTWDELIELSDRIVADGDTPWCMGFASGFATGWPGTDLIETLVLRTAGAETYVDWYEGRVPFTHPDIVAAGRLADQLVSTPGYVLGGRDSISREAFNSGLFSMLARDPATSTPSPACWLYPQAEFLLGDFLPNDVVVGVDIDFFMLPPLDASEPTPVHGDAVFAAALVDRPEVRAFVAFLASAEWGERWAAEAEGRFIPLHKRFNTTAFTCTQERCGALDPTIGVRRRIADIALGAVRRDLFLVDASDSMPPEIGASGPDGRPGAFWQGMIDWVDGRRTLDEVFTDIDAAWDALASDSG